MVEDKNIMADTFTPIFLVQRRTADWEEKRECGHKTLRTFVCTRTQLPQVIKRESENVCMVQSHLISLITKLTGNYSIKGLTSRTCPHFSVFGNLYDMHSLKNKC